MTTMSLSHPTNMELNGYTVFPNFLTPQQVNDLRTFLGQVFHGKGRDAGDIHNDAVLGSIYGDLFKYPEISELIFRPELVESVQKVLGKGFYFIPEHGMHRNGFGDWHKDTDQFERAGLQTHWHPDYKAYQLAIYLQDNSLIDGGGLSIVPGSHKVPKPPETLHGGPARDRYYVTQHKQILPSKAGDLICFDSRLDHRATPKASIVSTGRTKYAIFIMVAAVNEYATYYRDFIYDRYDIPHDYDAPPEYQEFAEKYGCRFTI